MKYSLKFGIGGKIHKVATFERNPLELDGVVASIASAYPDAYCAYVYLGSNLIDCVIYD